MASSTSRDSMEEFKGLRITSLGDDDREEDQTAMNDEQEDEDEEVGYAYLGFIEKPKNPCSLLRHYMPSKAGGVPAWLDPVSLPSGKSFLCDICGEPLQFMLQVYASDDTECSFHRTLFVFICTSLACLRCDQHEQWKRPSEKPSRCVKVFRSQLPQHNPFYSAQKDDKPLGEGAELCTWCGTWKGIKQCSSCKTAVYCSEKHRVKHSQLGHDYDCRRARILSESSDSKITPKQPPKAACTTLWPEHKIVEDYEKDFDPNEDGDDGGSSLAVVTRNDTDDGIKQFEGDDESKSWALFEERISWAPEQVLRYSRDPDSKPLWPKASGRPSNDDIPPCRHCGGPRTFEFQILPQLLYYFRVSNVVDSLDWSTIAVYTCKSSCEASVAYIEEFAWVQLA